MSIVSSRLSLTHRCTIQRDANAGTTNARGNPNPPDWQPLASNVACRAWTTAGMERDVNEAIVAVEDMRLLVAADTDVTTRDRIDSVTERGSTIIAGPVGIRAVIRQRDFLELVLVRLSG